MELPKHWTIVAQRSPTYHNGITLWKPINGYTYEKISLMYDLAMRDICFMIHKKTLTGYDLLVKENPNKPTVKKQMGIKYSTEYLSNKIYNN